MSWTCDVCGEGRESDHKSCRIVNCLVDIGIQLKEVRDEIKLLRSDLAHYNREE